MQMLDIAKKALQIAESAGAGQAEALTMKSRSMRVNVYKQEVEELVSSTGSGLGIRVFRDKAIGYAYTSDLSDSGLRATAEAAVAAAAITAADENNGLPEPARSFPSLDLFAPELEQTPVSAKIDLARRIERAALERDSRISQVESTIYAEGDVSVWLANSLGFSREYRETTCYAFLSAIAEQDGEMQTGVSFTTGRQPGQLEAEATGVEAADRALSLLGARQCESMTCPMVFDPFVTSSVVGVIGGALTGEAVQKKRSMFAGREGQEVASAAVRLVDDGTDPEGLATAPFDGEGVPSRATVLIKDGVLQGFLYDTYTGRKDGKGSTGNGVRGSYRGQPHVGPTNLILEPGEESRDAMIAGIDLGFYVMEVTGIHSGVNPISGDFSVGAAGRLIRNGNLAEPVREVTIAGNLLAMLRSIKTIGNDSRWVPFGGSIYSPSLLLREMTLGGK